MRSNTNMRVYMPALHDFECCVSGHEGAFMYVQASRVPGSRRSMKKGPTLPKLPWNSIWPL